MNEVKQVIEKPVRKNEMSILIVDDRPENLLTLESIIEKEGRKIIKAGGGNEALRIAIRENIGLIMMDIQMPEIDGIQVARLLRSNKVTRHIPIIFVSAINSAEHSYIQDFEVGTVDSLNKPLDMNETRNKVALHEKMYHLRTDNSKLQVTAEKNAAQFEQFIYIVSHDLKAPLRAIDNLTNWISDDLAGMAHESTTENLGLMKSRVNRMRSLLEGVLEFSRCNKFQDKPEPVDLNKLSHAIFESLEPASGCTLEASGLPVVIIEPARMYIILYQLLKNAILHHHEPGLINILVTCETSDLHHVISVIDNGPGIKPQYAQKIFDIFTTLKSKDDLETTGIGLPIVRKVLEDIDEKIWLDTEQVKGSVFRFSLPVNTN